MRETKPKTYRVEQKCIDGVRELAVRWDIAEGEVIERLIGEELLRGKGVGSKKESEEKPGEIRGFFQVDKKAVVMPRGVTTGDKVKEPAKKKVVGEAVMDIEKGCITNQVNNLRVARINAKPWDRNRQTGR